MVDAQERFLASGPLRIWTERVGDPGLPAVLMIIGSAAQGVSCPDALVGRLAERGARVIRFDHRDTGRSSVVDFDAHPYTFGDMARDCLAVLDGYGLPSAHVAGTSMGGMIAQWLGVHAPQRVRCLTLMSSSPMGHDPSPAQPVTRSAGPVPDAVPHVSQRERLRHSQSGVFRGNGRPPVDDEAHPDQMGRHRKRRELLTPNRFLIVIALGLAGYLAALTEAGVIRWTG